MSYLIIAILSFSVFADYVVVESDTINSFGFTKERVEFNNKFSIVKMSDKEKESLSHFSHENLHICGGYFSFADKKEAKKFLSDLDFRIEEAKFKFLDLKLNKEVLVKKAVSQVREQRIIQTIKKLSSFHNRHYKSETGVQSQEWLKSKWESLTSHRSDTKVEFFNHKWSRRGKYNQASVILTIKGSEQPDEIVVLGGHGDSIHSKASDILFPSGAIKRIAPGADDNASGIASLTEALTSLVEQNYRPKKTIQFISYAAEEVGLLGSNAIAKAYRKQKKNVVGVLQLDMTNFKGDNIDIHLVENKTNRSLNEFLSRLIDQYIKVPWGYTNIGKFASSDHASWTAHSFPSAFPTEASFETFNRKIHTEKDTIDVSNGGASHAVKFAKLATAFAIEMGK